MKLLLISLLLLLLLPSGVPHPPDMIASSLIRPSRNLIIITLDGVRWQEVYRGADPDLISDQRFTTDGSETASVYGGETNEVRRQRLMPFLWASVSENGQLYGNRDESNRVNTANLYAVSYPGYHEMFTGNTDLSISSNDKKIDQHLNVLEYLNGRGMTKGRVAAFTSWDVLPYMLGEARNGLMVNGDQPDPAGTRSDDLTMGSAEDYFVKARPGVLFIGLGMTDEYAHQGRYDLYLGAIHNADRMIAEIWNMVQSTPGYKDNTTLLITTDHGRGSRHKQWKSHGALIKGSSQTWMALLGPGVSPLGEVREKQQLYQQQIASLIAELVGERFGDDQLVSR